MRQVELRAARGGRAAASVMTRNPVVAGLMTSVAHLVEGVMPRHGVGFVPIVEGGIVTGFVAAAMVRGIDRESWDETRAGDILDPPGEAAVAPDLPTEVVLDRMARTGRRQLMATKGSVLLGVVTLRDLMTHGRVAAKPGRPR